MNRHSNGDWLTALLTAGSFFATLSATLFAFCDSLEGSHWATLEFCFALICAAAFASLLTTNEPAHVSRLRAGEEVD